MDIKCKLKIELENKEKIVTIFRSTKVDDFNYVNPKINGKKLEATIKASSISSLLHTLDDYLACLSVAMKVVDKD